MLKNLIPLLLIAILFNGCIGDDIIFDEVDPVIRISNPIDSIAINTNHQFEFVYLNNVGVAEQITPQWSSSDQAILQIDANGLAQALQAGTAEVSVSYQNGGVQLSDSKMVTVGDTTVVSTTERSGTIMTTSSYTLTGDFKLSQLGDNDLLLSVADNYEASSSLPGLYIYLTNNPNTTANALELGMVEVYSGAHSYTIEDVAIDEYSYVLYFCKPFNVKVGDGAIN